MMGDKKHKFALVVVVVSLIFLFGTIFSIKMLLESPQKNNRKSTTNFNFSKIQRIQNKRADNEIKKKRKKIKKRLKALRPQLNAQLSGSSFGLNMEGLGSINLDNDLLSGSDDFIMDENSVDTKPRILSRSPVEFPEKAISDNISNGSVEVRLLIDPKGHVSNTEILRAEPKGYFEDVTIAMVQQWRFEPATYQGRNVSIWARQVVKFGQ